MSIIDSIWSPPSLQVVLRIPERVGCWDSIHLTEGRTSGMARSDWLSPTTVSSSVEKSPCTYTAYIERLRWGPGQAEACNCRLHRHYSEVGHTSPGGSALNDSFWSNVCQAEWGVSVPWSEGRGRSSNPQELPLRKTINYEAPLSIIQEGGVLLRETRVSATESI